MSPDQVTAYERTTRDGQTLNYRTLEMLTAAGRQLSFPIVITQGSYTNATDASAGTHAGGGALDVRAKDLSAVQRDQVVLELRLIGFAAWLRTPLQGNWPYHIHAIAIGDRDMSLAAAMQVIAYRNGRNGLKNNGPDDGPRVHWTEYPQQLQELNDMELTDKIQLAGERAGEILGLDEMTVDGALGYGAASLKVAETNGRQLDEVLTRIDRLTGTVRLDDADRDLIAEAVAAKLGPNLAAAIAEELAARLQA